MSGAVRMYRLEDTPVGRIVTIASWLGGTFEGKVTETHRDVKNGRRSRAR